MAERIAECGRIQPVEGVHDAAAESLQASLCARQETVRLLKGSHQQGAGGGDVGKTEQDGSQQGKHEGENHRLKHLATHSCEEEDGDKDKKLQGLLLMKKCNCLDLKEKR